MTSIKTKEQLETLGQALTDKKDLAKAFEIVEQLSVEDLEQTISISYGYGSSKEQTPIEIAFQTDTYDLVGFMLNKGVSASGTAGKMFYVLMEKDTIDHKARFSLATQLVPYLSNEKAIFNLCSEYGYATAVPKTSTVIPLNRALIEKNMDFMQLLLDLGANPLTTQPTQPSPLYIALATDDFAAAKILMSYSCPFEAAKKGQTTEFLALVASASPEQLMKEQPGTRANLMMVAAASPGDSLAMVRALFQRTRHDEALYKALTQHEDGIGHNVVSYALMAGNHILANILEMAQSTSAYEDIQAKTHQMVLKAAKYMNSK